MQPFSSVGWLEYAKLEEEAGRLELSKAILDEGLKHCTLHEGLVLVSSATFRWRVQR